jgi:hypothetical protein
MAQDPVINASLEIKLISGKEIKKNGFYLFADNFDSFNNPHHVAFILRVDGKTFKFHYDGGFVTFDEYNFSKNDDYGLLEIKALNNKNYKTIINSAFFNLERFITNVNDRGIKISYGYPYEIDNSSFNKLTLENETVDNFIDISSFRITCSTIVVYALNSIFRVLNESFQCLKIDSWPPNENEQLETEDTHARIRIKPKECLHISIPESTSVSFPLTHDYCNRFEFKSTL